MPSTNYIKKVNFKLTLFFICSFVCLFVLFHFLIFNFTKVWRVGFMGHNSSLENVDKFLRLFKEALEAVKNRPKSQI